MTNVKKGADPNVAVFPRKSYRVVLFRLLTKNAQVSLCKAYKQLCRFIVINICIHQA